MSYEDGMPAGGNSRFRGYPARMSERQQLALLLQMTSQDNNATQGSSRSENSSSQSSRSSPLQHQRGSKNRWSSKNGEPSSSSSRKEERVRQMLINGYNPNSKDQNSCSSPEESGVGGGGGRGDSPVPSTVSSRDSTSGTSTSGAASSSEQGKHHHHHLYQQQQHSCYQQQQSGSVASPVSESSASAQEDSGTSTEMRKTPPQNKVDRSASGQTGSSPRVTLRLNQVRSSRDEKKGSSGGGLARQSGLSSQSQNQMDSSGKSSSSSSNVTSGQSGGLGSGAPLSNPSSGGNNSSSDSGDVYEFKSSKEATPVRGSSNSPNPSCGDGKDAKESSGKSSSSQSSGGDRSQISGGGIASSCSSTANVTVSSSAASDRDGGCSTGSGGNVTDEALMATHSPLAKRAFEAGDNPEDQEDEVKKKKRKDESGSGFKESGKGSGSGRVTLNRNTLGSADKCSGKSGKQQQQQQSSSVSSASGGGSSSAKSGLSSGGSGQGASSSTGNNGGGSSNSSGPDRKSPNSVLTATNSPSAMSIGSISKVSIGSAPMTPESDGETDDRPRSSNSDLAPKVPPLKIVIPQSTASEQDQQGSRNGKNPSNRAHQLPYVVASSSSNDSSNDKDQNQPISGTTSPIDSAVPSASTLKPSEDKKDASSEKKSSSDHQRVLRSSHRSGTGSNGNGNSVKEEASPQAVDRSNNSSPQQHSSRHHSPAPETSATSTVAESGGKSTGQDSGGATGAAASGAGGAGTKLTAGAEKMEKVEVKKEPGESGEVSVKKEPGEVSTGTGSVDLHPRKRKMKSSKESQQATTVAVANEIVEAQNPGPEIHPHDQPITNCVQLFLNIRKQIERRRKGLFPVQPKPPQGFKDYLMNRCNYVLANNASKEPTMNIPPNLAPAMKDLFVEQERERHQLKMQHVVEKEKLVLSVEQEILRVHGRAARALANQSMPFSVCTILKDEEVYNVITPEQEEKDRNARSRYNGRLFLSWLQDVDDKWEKIKESMLLRHHNEAESLHAVQKMDWEWKLKEEGLCEFKVTPKIEDIHVPMVHVSDDFDLLPP